MTAGPWWRPLPQPVECSISLNIVPPSPVPVESITLLQDLPLPIEITEDNRRALERFDLSWSPSLEPHGEIREYVVYVGSSLQQGSGFEKFTVNSHLPPCPYIHVLHCMHALYCVLFCVYRMAMRLL